VAGSRQIGAKKANEERIDNDPKQTMKHLRALTLIWFFLGIARDATRGMQADKAWVGQCN
jgi:hypothetical protein